ncbi:MAG: methyltransferase domain-containing protein [Candidatus Heimdallarchaeota archaeon]|nr:methyltransferase domain-containing protein [Candidatus Heimdallarchaeota archaeon]MCK4769555.1 methyltransferase domain-containing protein [Candidatus Heimdallarchaeota archaeon]
MSEEANIPEIPGVDKTKTHITPFQEIVIKEIPSGSIIDIGAGGEGVIAQIGNERVTAIDKNRDEIDEAKDKAPKAKWMVADALDLSFENEEFDNATSFFSGMYMSNEDKRKAFKEVHRVIAPGGEFWIWDSKIKIDKERFLIVLTISLPSKDKFNTGYGTSITDQDEKIYEEYLKEAGFSIEEIELNKYWFFIRAKKT